MHFWHSFLGYVPERKRSFPGEQPGETVYYLGVYHWAVLLPLFLKFLFACSVLILFNYPGVFSEMSPSIRFFVNSISITILIHYLSFRMFSYFLKVIIITNFRLIEVRHSVFLKREREVIPMTNIQDFRYQQNGILPRLFGFGDLIVLGSSTDVRYEFLSIPKVDKIHHLLGELQQKALSDLPRSLQERKIKTASEKVPVQDF